jgi:glutamate dehydrogenase (NAD(P)+)
VKKNRSIAGYPAGKKISPRGVLQDQGDIFAPAALEGQIGVEEAKALRRGSSPRAPTAPHDARGREDPPRPRHRDHPRRARQLGRRHGELLRVGAEQAQRELDLEEVDDKLEKAMKRTYREVADMSRARRSARCASRPTPWRSSASSAR